MASFRSNFTTMLDVVLVQNQQTSGKIYVLDVVHIPFLIFNNKMIFFQCGQFNLNVHQCSNP